MADPLKTAFDAGFDRLAKAQRHPAIGAGFALANGAIHTRTSGDRYRGAGPVGSDAPWHIGSVTKGFTAALVMQLVESDALSLEAPISTYLPSHADQMHPSWAALRLDDLLGHTAGLSPNFTNAQMLADYGDDLPAERLSRLKAHWQDPVPGPRGPFAYSNMGYVLVGVVLETVTATPWEDLVKNRLGAPLGLHSMGTGAPRGDTAPWGHRASWFGVKPVDPSGRASDNPAWLGPAGTLHLSVADLVRWGQAHLLACRGDMPTFLSAQSCQTLLAPRANGYGLGWMNETLPPLDLPIVGHEGSNTMWLAHITLVPKRDTVFVFMTNDGRLKRAAKSVLALGSTLLEAP